MEKKFKLLPPTMPNFISMETPVGKRQDGIGEPRRISIAEFSEEEAEQYGELMKQTFIEHCKNYKLKNA